MCAKATFIFFITSKYGTFKDQRWAFGPPMWASRPLLYGYNGSYDHQGCGKTFLFYDFYSKVSYYGQQGQKSGILTIFIHILASGGQNMKLMKKMNECIFSNHLGGFDIFFLFYYFFFLSLIFWPKIGFFNIFYTFQPF